MDRIHSMRAERRSASVSTRGGAPRTGGPGLSARTGVAVMGLAALLAGVTAACVSGSSGVLARTEMTTEDLSAVRGQYNTVYDFLKAHGRADFTDLGGRSHEILTVWGRGRRSLRVDNPLGALLYVDEEEVPNPVPLLRQMSMDDVARMRILRPSEASSRFGGDGRRGAVAIWTRED